MVSHVQTGQYKASSQNGASTMVFSEPDKLEPSDLRTVKCYRCYSQQVAAVCHHCGRFVCRACCHEPSGWLFADNLFAYLKPLPTARFKKGAHCKDCYHEDVRLPRLFALLVVATTLLIFLVFIVTVTWLRLNLFLATLAMLITFGVTIVLVITYLLIRRRTTKQKFPRLSRSVTFPYGIPVFSKSKIEVEDRLTADFNITAGEYLALEEKAAGQVTIELNLTPRDQERYQSLRKTLFSKNNSASFHAGFAALETMDHVEFARAKGRRQKNLLTFTRNLAPHLFTRRCTQSNNLSFVERYHIKPKIVQKKFPVSFKPRLLEGGRLLEIKLEITKKPEIKAKSKKKGTALAGKPKLDRLILDIPLNCEVKDTDGELDAYARKVTWQQKNIDANHPLSLRIEFRHPVDRSFRPEKNKQGISLKGCYQVTIDDWTISQLHVARDLDVPRTVRGMMRMTNGFRVTNNEEWMLPTTQHRTIIKGKLTIETRYLSSQTVQTIPNDLDQAEELVGKEELLVAPTYHVINEIVEALTANDIFIKQVTEVSGDVIELETGNKQARYWEIRGKHYREHTYPVDLHLVISGEEPRDDQPNCLGSLNFELSLRSPTEVGHQEAGEYLKEDYQRFIQLIKVAAYKGRQVNFKGRRIVGWQKEQELEKNIKDRFGVEKVAIILTESDTVQGYIFSEVGDNDIDFPDDRRWPVFKEKELPTISIAQDEDEQDEGEQDEDKKWIDKWALLSKVETRY